MKLKIGTQRKIRELVDNTSDKVATDLLSEYGITEDTLSTKRYDEIIQPISDDLSISSFRKIWKKLELIRLFDTWVSIYKIKERKLTFTNFKSLFKHDKFKPNNHFMLNLSENKSLKIFQFTFLSSPMKGMMDKAGSDDTIRDSIYWLPDEGILLTRFHKDDNSKFIDDFIKKNVNEDLEQFRIKSMIISKFYREMKIIKQLNVSAVFEITGFAGFDEISFKGNHVKQGLYGLHKRQDIRVNLDQIGPNIQAASENLHLKIGPQIQVKNIEGFKELKELISN
jgi:hypothetical protein